MKFVLVLARYQRRCRCARRRLAETQLATFQLPDDEETREIEKFFDEGIKRVTDLRNAYKRV